MTDWSNLSLSAKERKSLETVLDASRTDYQQTMKGVSDYVDTLVGDLFDFDHPDKSLALTDPDAIVDAARNLVEVAQTAADNRYGVQRQAWQHAAGLEFPEYALPDREDWTRVMWDVQKGFANTDYNGLTYRQVMAGKARSGVTIMDLLPKTAGMSVDDMQQAYADFFRSLAAHAGQRRQMANIADDPTRPRWARVPRGGVTCAFCTMLAGRGFVYTSEEAAGGGLGNRYHNHCDCEPVPSWGEAKLSGYDPEKLDSLYQQAKAQAPDGSGYRDILAKMRSLGKVSDKISSLFRKKTSLASNPEAAVYSVLDHDQYGILAKIIDSADGPAKQLYLANENTFKIPNLAHGQDISFYHPAYDRVTINLDSVFEATKEDPSPIGDTWFHEFGHNIDHRLSSSGLTYSFEYQHGAFITSLMDEASARVNETRDRYADVVSSAINSKDEDMLFAMNEKGIITYADYVNALKGVIGNERISELCKPSLSKARKLVAVQLSSLPRDTTIAVSDIMNGATLGKVRDGWFHPGEGYWDLAGEHLATEAFAEMFAAHISTPQAWETALIYFPESCAMFETMLKEAM
jgi:hypothetical protein